MQPDEIRLTLEHESAHLAVARLLNVRVDSVEFRYTGNVSASTFIRVSPKEMFAEACVSAAPLAVCQPMSNCDKNGLDQTLLEQAEKWVEEHAEKIREVASALIEERLFLFAAGWRGVMHDPLGNCPRLEAL